MDEFRGKKINKGLILKEKIKTGGQVKKHRQMKNIFQFTAGRGKNFFHLKKCLTDFCNGDSISIFGLDSGDPHL